MRRRRRALMLVFLMPLYALLLAFLAMALATIIIEPLEGWVSCWQVVSAVFQGDFNGLINSFGDATSWMYFYGPAILVSFTQLLFLFPVVSLPQKGQRGHSLMLSFI